MSSYHRHRARRRAHRAAEYDRKTSMLLREHQLLAAAEAERTAQQEKDLLALELFKTRKAAEYFNAEAARHPEQAAEFGRLAAIAAEANPAKRRRAVSDYTPEESLAREWHVARDRYRDGIDRYGACMIREFMTADAARWTRLERDQPALVAKLKPGKPIAIGFRIDLPK